MQPYQEAGEEVQRHASMPLKALSAAGTAAATVSGGSAILNRIAPLLSSFIPVDTAIKGLSKVDPRIGRFINGAMKQGNPANEAMEFIKEKVDSGMSQNASKEKNIIEQVAPELHEFLKDLIGQGIMPKTAADKATKSGKFTKMIEALKKHTKQDIGAIVESIFGSQQKEVSLKDIIGQQPQMQAQQPQNQPQAQQQPQANQPNQALIQAIQAAQQSRQRRQKQ